MVAELQCEVLSLLLTLLLAPAILGNDTSFLSYTKMTWYHVTELSCQKMFASCTLIIIACLGYLELVMCIILYV
jgi:hypothetical protein